ncbi:hypothetical protein ABPG75_007973 [Micractinium tetrahymenae]
MAAAPAPLCRVCRERPAEYTCPRCNARYCSLSCYKQHSDRCTEGFYRDAAVAELKSISAGEEERRHMVEILQRLHLQEVEGGDGGSSEEESEEEGEEGGGLSQQTLHRLLAKTQAAGGELEVAAEDLSPEELAAFHRALAAGELSGAVHPWQPWWLSEEAAQLELGASGTPLVAEHAAGAAAAGQQGSGVQQGAVQQQAQQQSDRVDGLAGGSGLPPPPSRPLPPLAALTRAAPSPLLRYQLLDLLYAYCFTLRRYNGDYQWEAADAADTLFALSAVLAATAPGPAAAGSTAAGGSDAGAGSSSGGGGDASAGAAPVLLGCVQRACQPPVGSHDARGFAVSVLSDVAAMLQLGRPVVLTALMDATRLVEAARQQLEAGSEGRGAAKEGSGASEKEHKQRQMELRRRLVAAERKLLFFLSWANEQPPEAYELLALAAAGEHQKHAAALQEGQSRQHAVQGRHGMARGPAAAGAQAEAAPAPAAGQPHVLIEEIE